MKQWVSENLSEILGFQVPDDLIEYVMSINSENDLKEYLKTLLDFDNPQHKQFVSEICKQKFPGRGNSIPKSQKKKISKNKSQQDFVSKEPPNPPPVETQEVEKKGKTKTKYVNLYSQEGKNMQVILLKGRHHCDCQASKHDLVNNCLQCGRIVCKQEGSGPCLFCGNLVCTPEEQRALNAKTKASAKLMENLMERNRPKGWEAAVTHRNRLLEFDRTSERRTRVTDDDSDYFNTNSVWLSAGERDQLQQYQNTLHGKKHASRLDKKMVFDFAGRQIVEDNTIEHDVDLDKVRSITGAGAGLGTGGGGATFEGFSGSGGNDRDVAPGVNAPLLKFDSSVPAYFPGAAACAGALAWPRVQDAPLQEMSDAGCCLSMHQPWASLLVDGIKMHEGRTWYSSHRGRLWIASTVKPVDQHVVAALENQYRVLYPEKQLKFPSFYPTGCLLGCVTVDDCLNQEEYLKLYPDGESDSPYVFICSNPISLRLRFPIKGAHKIYKLDKTIHQAALKSIQKQSKMAAEEAHAG